MYRRDAEALLSHLFLQAPTLQQLAVDNLTYDAKELLLRSRCSIVAFTFISYSTCTILHNIIHDQASSLCQLYMQTVVTCTSALAQTLSKDVLSLCGTQIRELPTSILLWSDRSMTKKDYVDVKSQGGFVGLRDVIDGRVISGDFSY